MYAMTAATLTHDEGSVKGALFSATAATNAPNRKEAR